MTILATEAEQCFIAAKTFDAISNEEDDLSDSFTITVPFAYEVTQVPKTPESITNTIEQSNKPI